MKTHTKRSLGMIDDAEEWTFAETEISKLPIEGDIPLSFIRIYPEFKLIQRNIPLGLFSKAYKEVYDDLQKSGIKFKLHGKMNISLFDYHKFISKLFPWFEVEDHQNDSEKGRPDFFLKNDNGEFHIEFKTNYDNIRASQICWIGTHKKAEIWFMIMGDFNVNGGTLLR